MSYTSDDLKNFRSINDDFLGDGNDKMDVSINNNIKELLYFTQILNIEKNDRIIKRINIEIIRLKQLINIQLLNDNIPLIKVFKQISNYDILSQYIYIGIGTAPLSNHSEFFPDFLVEKFQEGKAVLAINIDESFDPNKGDAKNEYDFTTIPSGKKVRSNVNINNRSIKSLEDRIGIDRSKLIAISNDIVDYYRYFEWDSQKAMGKIFQIYNIKVNSEEKDNWFIKEIYKMIKSYPFTCNLLIYRVNCAGGNLKNIAYELTQLSTDTLYRNNLMEPYILATFPLKDSGIEIGSENCSQAKH